MEVGVTITVPYEVYQVYADSAQLLRDYTPQQVMAHVLCAYAKCIADGVMQEHVEKRDCQLC